MTFLTYDDLLPIFVISILFSLVAIAHRIVLPQMYSSILIFNYRGDYKKTTKSSAIRVLYVLILTILFYKVVKYTSHQIYLGIFIACFLNVWPAIIQYHLLSFWKSKEKRIILLGYISFIVFSVFVAYITVEVICPMIFENKEYALFSNDGLELIKTIILCIIPISFEGVLAKFTGIVTQIDIDTYLEEVKILNNQLDIENEILNAYEYEIIRICHANDINIELLKTIVALEYIYRGQWYNWLSETILCKYFPWLAIKKDISVGLTQIKISTAKEILEMAPKKFVNKLMDPEFNMDVCAKFLKKIIDKYKIENKENYQDIYEYIACSYLCDVYDDTNKTVLLYSTILRNRVGINVTL